MPLFDFQCQKCSRVFEKAIPFGSKTKPSCPHCRSKSVEKMLSMPGIAFKGSGFYKTDSRPAAKSEETTKAEVVSTPLPNVTLSTDEGPNPRGEGKPEKKAPESPKPDTSKK